MVLPIITLPHDSLRETSARIHVITDEVRAHAQNMIDSALDWEDSRPHEVAVALAAVQVDLLERIVIIRDDFDDKTNRKFTVLINPKIVKTEGKPITEHEGCLSVADIYGLVPRYPRVRVEALNLNGELLKFKANDFLARVLQHEIDHTNGICFIDHIRDQKDAFFTLNARGNLDPLPHDQINQKIFTD